MIPKSTFQTINNDLSKTLPVNEKCYRINTKNMPQFTIDDSCGGNNCGMSVGLLVTNGNFDKS